MTDGRDPNATASVTVTPTPFPLVSVLRLSCFVIGVKIAPSGGSNRPISMRLGRLMLSGFRAGITATSRTRL
jgi:hypothetical protein